MAAYRLAVVCGRLKTRARCRGSGSVQDPERRSASLGVESNPENALSQYQAPGIPENSAGR